jgi:protein TonB
MLVSLVAFLFNGGVALGQDQPDKTAETVYQVGNGVSAPKPRYTPDAEFSESARAKKIRGVVVLAMIVTAEGRVRDVKVIKSLDPGLDKQAIAAVRKWKFEPATRDGKPVAVHLETEVDFRLY